MTDARKARLRRRRLRAHDAGLNRHNKGLSLIEKWNRKHIERSRIVHRERQS